MKVFLFVLSEVLFLLFSCIFGAYCEAQEWMKEPAYFWAYGTICGFIMGGAIPVFQWWDQQELEA